MKEKSIDKNFTEYWDNKHSKFATYELKYDDWLDEFLPILNKNHGGILEIGCGLGNNAKFLVDHGITELATDICPKLRLKIYKKNCQQFKPSKLIFPRNYLLKTMPLMS